MSEPVTVKSIVKDYLKAHRYDGLYCPGIECGCAVASLMPCAGLRDGGFDDCQPGYTVVLEDGEIGIGPKGGEDA